jgi:hypothetical protein
MKPPAELSPAMCLNAGAARYPKSMLQTRVGSKKQIAQGPASLVGQHPLAQVFMSVVQHVAPLAKRRQIVSAVLALIMIEMCASQDHPGHADVSKMHPRLLQLTAAARPPEQELNIPPQPVRLGLPP